MTPMITGSIDAGGVLDDKSNGLWEGFEKRQGRKAHPVEVGDAVVVLSTPRMSLVNGVNLMIDGGFTINEGFE
jgi:hypothetical protein